MAPKKQNAQSDGEKVAIFSEVERTFLQQQVAECNRRIARLRSSLEKYETHNEELQKAYDKLDEDRSDIIVYLKKLLNVKCEEYNELKSKMDYLMELRETENIQFCERVTTLEKNFTTMKHQLSSENKLLAGKLNTLEEFRAIRDDLMGKFDKQEQEYQDQEMKYKRIIYNAEKKIVIGKNKLKKEMEARLLKLAQDFQDATELRIAASTHRVIRENIAINNELETILSTQHKLCEENEMYKENVRAGSLAKELAEEERDKAINKSIVQLKIINQLTLAFENIKKEKGLLEKSNYDFQTLQGKINKLTKENNDLTLQVRILEQNLHAKLCEENKTNADADKIRKERDLLGKILHDTAFAIKAALKLDEWYHVDSKQQQINRQSVLSNLLQIVSRFHDIQGTNSLETIASLSKIYDEGDLGFVPKFSTKKVSENSAAFSAFQLRQDSMRDESRKSVNTNKSFSNVSLDSSLETIPSIKVLPTSSNTTMPEVKASFESFMTSTQSITSDELESEHDDKFKTDIEKKLLASKLEIQKSILKDLAFSQLIINKSRQSLLTKPSASVVFRKTSLSLTPGKSVTIIDSTKKINEDDSSVQGSSHSPETSVTDDQQKIIELVEKSDGVDTVLGKLQVDVDDENTSILTNTKMAAKK